MMTVVDERPFFGKLAISDRVKTRRSLHRIYLSYPHAMDQRGDQNARDSKSRSRGTAREIGTQQLDEPLLTTGDGDNGEGWEGRFDSCLFAARLALLSKSQAVAAQDPFRANPVRVSGDSPNSLARCRGLCKNAHTKLPSHLDKSTRSTTTTDNAADSPNSLSPGREIRGQSQWRTTDCNT